MSRHRSWRRERRLLQGLIFLFGCIPVAVGGAGVLQGAGILDMPPSVSPDSHIRYLSGLLLGIGLTFWSLTPRLETQTVLFRGLTLIVFIGGLARLGGLLLIGVPSAGMLAGLGMELVVTPLLCLWQGRIVARKPE